MHTIAGVVTAAGVKKQSAAAVKQDTIFTRLATTLGSGFTADAVHVHEMETTIEWKNEFSFRGRFENLNDCLWRGHEGDVQLCC